MGRTGPAGGSEEGLPQKTGSVQPENTKEVSWAARGAETPQVTGRPWRHTSTLEERRVGAGGRRPQGPAALLAVFSDSPRSMCSCTFALKFYIKRRILKTFFQKIISCCVENGLQRDEIRN